jgi:hypothetical protein
MVKGKGGTRCAENAQSCSTAFQVIPDSYKPKKKFMQLAIAEAKRAGDRGDYPIGTIITRLDQRRSFD